MVNMIKIWEAVISIHKAVWPAYGFLCLSEKKNLVSILIFFKERVSFKSFTHRGGLTLVSQTNFYYDGHGFPYFYHLMCPLNYENMPTPIKELNSHF